MNHHHRAIIMFQLSTKALIRCLRTASVHGVDPYDSNPTQARVWKRAAQDKFRRSHSEYDANREQG